MSDEKKPEAPKFIPTHEHVTGVGKAERVKLLRVQPDATYVDEDGARYTRGWLEQKGSVRRHVPNPPTK